MRREVRASSVLTPAQIGMLVVGYVLLAVLSYLYLASGLVVPAPWLWGLWAVMVVLIGLSIRWWRRPVLVLASPSWVPCSGWPTSRASAPSSTGPPDAPRLTLPLRAAIYRRDISA
jgi:hypothetical protein